MRKILTLLALVFAAAACGGGTSAQIGGLDRSNAPTAIVDDCPPTAQANGQPDYTASDVSFSRTQGDYDVYDVTLHGLTSVSSMEIWVTGNEIHGPNCPFQNAPGQPLPS